MFMQSPKALFQQLLDGTEASAMDGKFVEVTEYILNIFPYFEATLNSFEGSFEGKTVLDFGCKFGHTLPLFLARGAARAIGIDVVPHYLETGREVFGRLLENVEYHQSDEGLIPIPSESVDLALAREVISHINPAHLDQVYAELFRVLRPEGQLLISDGNNLSNCKRREVLVELYDAWENGPNGHRTDEDRVTVCFFERRRQIVQERYPDLPESDIDYVARNTSGLFGQKLLHIVDAYVRTGELVERPYRRGTCPTNPGFGGTMIERGFYPQQVLMALTCLGFDAHQVYLRNPWADPRILNWKGRLIQWTQKAWESVVGHQRPANWRELNSNFTILAIKPRT